ncbi:dehydration-responsive element-binding protein 1F-like [Solanum dulcamara]|uniref:dehydration-responsive element-binding protein 1F-like n=1 Tax=Solanum dulcamara TaxID=45834 RepID=UPI002486A833|nr:dehydration-responsive element-binding protein 1F-like [Solanum dulcamara]
MNNNTANLERDHYLRETSSSSERLGGAQDEGMYLLASSQPKKRAGRKKFKETRHPIYKGVRRRNNNKWVCEVREPSEQKRIWLGTYPTPEMAARAHDVAALALRGNLATLNFADSSWQLAVPISKDPKELRQAAMKAAEVFRQDTELVRVDYMNEEINSNEEVKYQENIVVGGASGSDNNNLVGKEVNNIQYMEMEDNNEILEIEESSWQEKMVGGHLLSPTPSLGSYLSWDDVESEVEVSLWSYSM